MTTADVSMSNSYGYVLITFYLENVKIGNVLGDINIDFVDENEVTFLKCFVMV